ncbi:hypothetical protein [Qipengyuania sp.]|uniref:hypothetical protein n=1 Tax=Qipengyuania sp. TaxID=2004515 RepID=UPI003AF9C041
MLRIFAAIAALSLAVPAQAEWLRADSEHFVVFADDSAKDVARFAEMLERYHAAMSFVTGREVDTPSPSNRVTIYAVGSARNIRKLAGIKNIGGFYIPRAGSSVAFVPNVRPSSGELDFSMITLLHEYAHHFLIGSSRFAMPRWMNEGGAEFFASARFPRDGEVQIGRPAVHRAYELALAPDVSIENLLARGNVERGGDNPDDNFYGRSWALYHYLTFAPERKGQLLEYARRIAAGVSSREAAVIAFGDLHALDRDLDTYLKKRKMLSFVLQPDLLPIRPITVEQLSAGMDEMLPTIIRSKRGVDREAALEILEDAREVAARYPGDAGVLAALAEAEFDAGNDDASIAAADAALAIDVTVKNALVQKGFALFRKAEEADDEEAAFAAAMRPFSALNRLEPDHPLPLIYYYRSFVERGAAPNETARHALERAAQLSPFDRSLAMNAGLMQAGEGKIAIARNTLGPVAADPHGGSMARAAQRYLEELAEVAEGTEWSPPHEVNLTAALAASAGKNDDDDGDEEDAAD